MSGRHKRSKFAGSRRKVAATAIATVLTPAAATLGAPTAAAADDPTAVSDFGSGTYSGQASADGIRATLALRDYLIVEDFVDGGGPTAQAALDSLGDSTAYSSLPYPGATGVALPGLISTLSGKSVPSYPFYVTSQSPSNPTETVRQPGYLMHAESSSQRSAAQTQLGSTTNTGEEFGTFSTASVDFVGGTITSLGEARTRLAVGAVQLNGSFSRAVVTVAPGGKVTKSSTFETALRIGNTVIGVSDKGLVVGDQNAPLDPARQVEQAITQAGVTVKFLPAVETADSILSSGLEISMERAIPNVGTARGVVSYIVGRSFAQATAAGFTGGTTTGTPVAGAPAATDAAAAPGATIPTTAVPQVDASALPGAVPGVVAPAAPAVPTANFVNAATVQPDLTKLSFYPILAAIVPIMLLAIAAARRFV